MKDQDALTGVKQKRQDEATLKNFWIRKNGHGNAFAVVKGRLDGLPSRLYGEENEKMRIVTHRSRLWSRKTMRWKDSVRLIFQRAEFNSPDWRREHVRSRLLALVVLLSPHVCCRSVRLKDAVL